MKVGQDVNYVDKDGTRHTATVTGIVGAGASNYKLLNVSYTADGEDYTDTSVPHQGDAAEGSAFWYLKGEKRLRDVVDEHLAAEPVVESAFPEPRSQDAVERINLRGARKAVRGGE